jgi:hypothetical protein
MTTNPSDYAILARRVMLAIEPWLPSLDAGDARHVAHLHAHDEVAMALEVFVLSAMERQLPLNDEQKRDLRHQCVALGLHHESVARADFWPLASRFFADGAAS